MPFIERDGASVFYELLEASQTAESQLVATLVNGHTRSSGDFRLMARQLTNAGVPTLILDNRAAGKSKVTRPFSLREMEDDVVAVWDELGLKKANLLGVSMGGFIAQGISARFSERVGKLILVSTASGPEWIKATGGGWINEEHMIEEKLGSYFAPGFVERNQLLFDTMVRQTKIAIEEGRFKERSDMQRDALRDAPRDWTYEQIIAETLIIHGDEDAIVDVRAAEDLEKKILHATSVILPGVGHLILAEASKKLYELCTDWFEAAPSPR